MIADIIKFIKIVNTIEEKIMILDVSKILNEKTKTEAIKSKIKTAEICLNKIDR